MKYWMSVEVYILPSLHSLSFLHYLLPSVSLTMVLKRDLREIIRWEVLEAHDGGVAVLVVAIEVGGIFFFKLLASNKCMNSL